MKTSLRTAFVFLGHVGFLVGAYGSHLFGLAIPYFVVLIIWLGVSSVAAALAYCSVFAQSPSFGGVYRPAVFAVAATGLSVSLGVFIVFNVFGT